MEEELEELIPQDAAGYTLNAAEGRRCQDCVSFRPDGTCLKVEGEISPTGTCDLWESARDHVEDQMFNNPPVE